MPRFKYAESADHKPHRDKGWGDQTLSMQAGRDRDSLVVVIVRSNCIGVLLR